jgi:hypothetical protein
MITRVARPTPPSQPEDLRWMITEHNQLMKTMNNAIKYARQFPTSDEFRSSLWTDIRAAQQMIKDWYCTDEGRAYSLAVSAYNEQAAQWNAQVKRDRQMRRNTAETTKIRSAACQRCFATHAGEC